MAFRSCERHPPFCERRQGNANFCIVRAGRLRREFVVSLGGSNRRVERCRVDFEQQRAAFDVIILGDMDSDDRSGYACCDVDDVRLDVGIVGGRVQLSIIPRPFEADPDRCAQGD
jgi:hypothetical protein